ncbi:unnamed protein product, partial [Sphacelaria rigidula]
QAFRRITDSPSFDETRPLDAKAFQRNFLEAFPTMVRSRSRSKNNEPLKKNIRYTSQLPKVLADALFDAFGASRRGAISLEEFMCAVAVMHRGSAPEQLRMLFEVYDVRRATYIELVHVRRLLDAIYGPDHTKAVDVALSWLFRAASRDDEMEVGEFIDRLTPTVVLRGTPASASAEPLLRWFRTLCTRILEEPHPAVVKLEQRYNPDRGLREVQRKYRLSEQLVKTLRSRHRDICERTSTNALDAQASCGK